MQIPLLKRFPLRWEWRYSRFLIILAVLILSVRLAPKPSLTYVVLAVGFLSLLLFLRWPLVGLIFIFIASFFVPFSIGTGTQTSLNLVFLLIPVLFGLMLLDMLVIKRSIFILPSNTMLPLFFFLAVVLLSFLVGQLPWFPFAGQAPLRAQVGGLAIFFFSAFGFLLFAYQVRNLKWLNLLTWIFLLVGAFYMLGRLVSPFGFSSDLLVQKDVAAGSLFWVWLVSLSSGLALFQSDLTPGRRIFLLCVAVLTLLLGFINRSWASGLVPPFCAFMLLLWLRSWKWGLTITISMIVVFLILNPDFIPGLIQSDQYSIDTRLAAGQIVYRMVLGTNPILGLGPGNYYYYTPLYNIMGWEINFSSHSQYIDIFAQTGLLGMVGFLWLVASLAFLAWKLRESVGDGFSRGYVYACLAGLVGTLVAGFFVDWFIPFIYNIGVNGFRASIFAWLFLGGLVAVEQIYKNPGSGSLEV